MQVDSTMNNEVDKAQDKFEKDLQVDSAMNNEVDKAQDKFEKEFEFREVDTMIHRFPPALRDEMKNRYPYMVVPRFVAIGPYHHGKKHLEKMEVVKNAAAAYLCQRVGFSPANAMKEVRAVLTKARGKYYLDDETAVDVDCFAAMMFRDACFLLLYMDVYDRSYGDKEDLVVNMSMRRFLFSNRDCIESDIMLLENQVPWRVIQALAGLAKNDDLYKAVGKFITGMGNSFKITESCDDHSQKEKKESCDDPPATYDELKDKNNPPAHLLEVLRRHTTKSNNNHTVLQLEQDKPPAVTSISWMSAVNLEEIGIKLKVLPTATFSDMHLEKGLLLNRRLTLAPLSLSETTASCLVNLAALEVCTESRFGDHGNRTAVCSYLALLDFLMVGTEDVRRLRSIGLLYGTHNDGEMLAFFNAVAKHLQSGKHFAFLMGEIEEYKKRRPIRTTLYKWVYNHYVTIIKAVSLIVTIIGLYKALSSVIHKN